MASTLFHSWGPQKVRSGVICLTLLCFVLTQTAAVAGPTEEGTAAGQAANPSIRSNVNAPSATTLVPNYTATPPERTYYGQPSLTGAANARLAACATTADDPVCQAQQGAVKSANTPRPPVLATDPAVTAAHDIANNPANTLGGLGDFYSGCTTANTTVPAGTTDKVCNRYSGVGRYTSGRDLTVQVERVPNCNAGDWFAHSQVNRNGADYMVAEAQCEMRTDGLLRMRFYAAGGRGACIGWQTVEVPAAVATNPAILTNLSPHWSGHCWSPFQVVLMPGSGCINGQCNYSLQFGAGSNVWTVPLSFTRPALVPQETDHWIDRAVTLPTDGRCAVASAERCVDGPSTKMVDGHAVTRACWSYQSTLTCDASAPVDECAPLAASGCTPLSGVCKQTDPATGACEVTQATYRCPTAAQTTTAISNCPANVFCLGTTCFNTSYTNDADFARSMTYMEAAREAGVYLDPVNMRVFKGEGNRCRNRLLKDCCYADGAGSGMSNQSMFGTGSRLVFDVLMNSENQQFLYQGMQALLMSGGFSGTFTTYGVTVAVNGAALPAGSAVLYSGESMVVAFDPWSLAIAVVIYIVMSMMSCNEEEGKLAMKEGAGLCHSAGSWCSSCIRVLGKCVSCIERTTGKCCFNSMLARLINEQGRVQIGKGWGSGQNPDCSGFTIAELQSLDFAAMDLSEFYASIVPTLPNVGAMQGSNAGRVGSCYYGQGKCP